MTVGCGSLDDYALRVCSGRNHETEIDSRSTECHAVLTAIESNGAEHLLGSCGTVREIEFPRTCDSLVVGSRQRNAADGSRTLCNSHRQLDDTAGGMHLDLGGSGLVFLVSSLSSVSTNFAA